VRSAIPVLSRPHERAAFTRRLGEVDRLVLLGDTIELRQGPTSEMLSAASSVFEELGAALGPDKEVVIVPGNHDHRLLNSWRERRAAGPAPGLGPQSELDWRQDEPLGVLAAALAPARVRACYPGLWLREDVYAIHGHYLDRHITFPIMERLGAGVMARLLGRDARTAGGAAEYEAVLGPMYAWLDAVFEVWSGVSGGLQVRVWRSLRSRRRRRTWRQHGTALALPIGVAALNRIGLGPLGADLSASELRRAGLRAFEQVLRRLEVPARHVIFGHTHRAGPLPGDERQEWVTSTGSSMVNTGSWVRSPEMGGESLASNPYRPGFVALVGDEGPPQLVNLLDGIGGASSPALQPTAVLRPDPA
jgi:hypothetical protein